MNITTIITSTFNSIFKLVFVVIAGFLATKTANFNETIRRGYSTIVFQYLVPAVIFAQTATAVDRIDKIFEWWYLILICLIINLLSFPSIWFVAKLFRLDKLTTRVFVYSIAFGNTMYIPLALVDSITSESSIFGENGKEIGGAYICTYLLLSTLIYWIFGYSYVQRNQIDVEEMKKQKQRESENENENVPLIDDEMNDKINVNKKGNEKENKEVEIEMNEINNEINEENKENKEQIEEIEQQIEIKENEIKENENEEEQIKGDDYQNNNQKDTENKQLDNQQQNNQKQNKLQQCLTTIKSLYNKIPESIRRIIKNVFTPPSVATILGIILILIYPLRDLLFNDGALSIFGRCFEYLGGAAVISALFILGGNLSSGPKGGNVKWYVIVVALIIRLIVVPSICIALNFVLWYYDIIAA